jgi:phosphopantothenoylcysteine decarboxylase/phosphopantothenate--cysteine ligase
MTEGRLAGRRVAVGVSGGIAAYKAIECIRMLTEAGAEVRVLMTPEATRFVTPLTFEALSYHPVAADWLTPQGGGETHIKLAEWAEVIAIIPATANTIAKLALGLADEIVSGTALASRAPLVLAPAMNDVMLTQQQTQDHLNALRARRAVVVEPASGRLASGKSGMGRLAAPERIIAVIEAALADRRNLDGLRVVVSAGGTREAIDPIRYVGNFSSGKMGRALAEVAAARGKCCAPSSRPARTPTCWSWPQRWPTMPRNRSPPPSCIAPTGRWTCTCAPVSTS